MSHTGGGLAQMSFTPNHQFDKGLGLPGQGFASRRGAEVFNRRLSTAPPASITTIHESQASGLNGTPRTSRSHLLAGLRTAPKTPTVPNSAPLHQLEQSGQLAAMTRANTRATTGNTRSNVPHTSVGMSFGRQVHQPTSGLAQTSNNAYTLPEILAPPELDCHVEPGAVGMDPDEYANLMAHGQQLAQQQYLLQQQLLNLTMAQQQMQNLGIGNQTAYHQQQQQQQQYMQANAAQQNALYQQQLRNGVQPIVTAVPGTPGLYSVFNPMTGQQTLMVDEAATSQATRPKQMMSQGQAPMTPTFRAQVSPPPESNAPVQTFGSPAPMKSMSPPHEHQSTSVLRRQIKQLSAMNPSRNNDAFKTSTVRSSAFPATPQTGTFGPGQSRVGDHPIREPRGPPAIEELVAKPTAKHEGSKNFVARQRRRALNSLVKAGVERRGCSPGCNSPNSPSSGSPASDYEVTFSAASDIDTESVRSSKSGSVHGAIGSERKQVSRTSSRDRFDGISSAAGSSRQNSPIQRIASGFTWPTSS